MGRGADLAGAAKQGPGDEAPIHVSFDRKDEVSCDCFISTEASPMACGGRDTAA